MPGNYVSIYLRIPFSVDDPATIRSLTLTVDYDDAFVAYLNGQEVARSNVIGNPPSFTQLSSANHECSGGSPDPNPAEDFSINTTPLVSGLNVLALQGHNRTLTSSDFSLIPSLTATIVGECVTDGDCDDGLYCNGIENCSAGTCQSGAPVVCDDGVVCTVDSCNESTDSCEYSEGVTDTDGDGIGDACDPCPVDPGNDIDEDGVCGDVDNCPTGTNALQVDADADGVGDVCDNCVLDPNPTQADLDGDGLGEACDPCPYLQRDLIQ